MLKKLNYDNSTKKYWMELTEEELQLIASLNCLIRLGSGSEYSDAALTLAEGIAELKGDDYDLDALSAVNPSFTVCDDSDNPLITIEPLANLIIEV
jgi:hypothetical protein